MLLCAGLLSGLLGTPAAAAEEPATLPADVRAHIVGYWETGGAGLKVAAEQALLGGDEAIRTFLDEAESIQLDDNRVDTARLVMTGGPGMRLAAKEAMLKSPAELEAFLLYGYEEPLDEDRKVEIARLVTLGGPGVQAAGKAALQGTFDDRELFLTTGQYTERQDDNRVEVARLAGIGGPNVQAAARVALRGTPEDMVEFLEIGQFTARDRDQEHSTIAQLIEQAKQAGKLAEDARKTAEESSKKAAAASQMAKEAAQKAAEETAAAKDDSKKAAVKAKQAADAARGAAEAAQEAIGAANAANRAARRAALAAAQTASAAAAAAEAANKAYKAAIAAAGDKANAAATAAAKEARAAATAASTSAEAALNAGAASEAAALAAGSAKGASTNARAAATAAEEANGYADAAGVHSDAARQAAIEARRNADAADRAADRSAALARRSATAAYGARDAANSAAAHANKSADYADDAAAHAGDSATYASVAQKNADGAKQAAATATTAVAKAKDTFDLARETETADLQTRTEAAIERARSMKSASGDGISAAAASQVQARSLNATATELAQEANRPDVDIQATAAKGRELAIPALELLGPWHQEAAARALSGTDQDVLDYLRTRWKEAGDNDTRQRVVNLSTQSPYAGVRTAATTALADTPEQINTFYATGQYEAGLDDMKVDVAKLATTGGPSVNDKAKAALADGTGIALATFLQIGQYGERLTDENVITARLAETGEPELSSAAKIALAGPPQLVHEFITIGQYQAQREDDLATTHIHQVDRLLAEGSLIAAKAGTDAWRAAEAAASAKGAADAAAASTEARNSEKDAAQYAANAGASAAADAAAATTARNAANRADTAAENSAANAEFSASYARESARKADTAANDARASAIAAGKSRTEAEAAASEAWKATRALAEKELEEALRQAELARQEEQRPTRICGYRPWGTPKYVPILPCHPMIDEALDLLEDLHKAGSVGRDAFVELSGLGDIEKCITNPTAFDCTMAAVGVMPWGKLKLLAKIDKGLDAIKGTRAARRTVACLAGTGHSFPAGTKVLMADGTGRPIEQIETGDLVTATDPTTGETGPRRVTRTIHTPDDRNFTDVTLTDNSTLTSTSHHPYWSENDQAWKNASDLQTGDTLRTPQNHTAAIAHTRNWQGLQDAYDLTVDDLHTYYAFTGTTYLLVHNTEGIDCPGWVKNLFDKLPVDTGLRGKTYGNIRDSNGNVIPAADTKELRELMSGEHDSLFDEADALLQSSGHHLYPQLKNEGKYRISSHVEAKYAAWMKNNGIAHATVVINKNSGVCAKKLNCENAVEAILPAGHTMKVYYPGDGSPGDTSGEEG
ncbi:DddA-like double-stranded DNA deaminase toxin [Streptomyces sp. NPDC058001]|uniref:DddA-like double-stranded DNA deaminase toxin n=1 Tax=Streptomyces sp. NPDC058001 TaxID=3346300 RepID=UPI0036EBF4FA